MDLVATAINAAVILVVGALLSWQMNGRFKQIDRGMDSLERRMDSLERRLERRMDSLERSVDSLRSDLTRVALVVGAEPEAETGR